MNHNLNILNNKHYQLAFFLIVLFTYTSGSCAEYLPESADESADTPIMAVFIHGSVGSLISVPLLDIMAHFGLEEEVHNHQVELPYEHVTASLKDNHRAYYMFHQPLRDFGLAAFNPKLLDTTPDHLSLGTYRIASTFEQMHELISDQRTPGYRFYTFGWDGQLSIQARRSWAAKLYDALHAEKEKLSALLGKEVKIHLFTHSHGGNVALYLKEANDRYNKNLRISHLITLGCPVQSATASYINSDVFERITHIYSPSDYVQITDVFSTDGLSYRTFAGTKENPLPSKLTQVEIHIDSTTPGHGELWFVGLSPVFYNSSLSIYPLPVISFVPLIIDVLDQNLGTKHISIRFNKDADAYILRAANTINGKYLTTHRYGLTESFKTLLNRQTDILLPYYEQIWGQFKKAFFFGGIGCIGVGIAAKYWNLRNSG